MSNTILKEANKRKPSQKTIMVNMLKKAGSEGVTNVEFSRVANCYGARLSELHSVGYIIAKESLGDGVYKYILEYAPDNPKKAKKKIDELVDVVNNVFDGKVTGEELDFLIDELSIKVSRKSFPNLK
jgi:hypothetical protein